MSAGPVAVCPTCGASDWGSRKRCKPCRAREGREQWSADLRAKHTRWRRAWRAANPEAERAASRRYRYGLTPEAFDALVNAQGGKCRICGRRDPGCVDHCHTTGRVRGVLCLRCNAGLGHFRDDSRLLRAAAEYLARTNV
jgi:hypothetical protein